ncbi:MAG: glycoside hydrolase family 16 protein [Bacteroidales bacterium]|jgi:beta-glucanase (GH16 family)|nr:glycoside hydrolase family 16 protein [Bacteroidales bacterium]MDD2688415.1 glycoside hydrolase family 16 protein [Bacteroidales bacterium]MDD3331384.1 glycoside hydrolase family 16 protein [Bacteroidales bacterium]MDD3691189.1 glycoside hydrolase family 16 protein [Bacteroidales bacterium]
MKKEFTLIVLEVCFVFSIFSQNPPQDKNWDTVFIDNFNAFDTNRWRKPNEAFHGEDENIEPQIYLSNNVYLNGNGKLILEVNDSYYFCNSCKREHNYYTSGEIVSTQTYQYGYFEIICKLPKGKSFWPAFWLWNDNNIPPLCWYNEIDIFEMDGSYPNQTHYNFHWNYDCPRTKNSDLHDYGQIKECDDYSLNFHSYSLEWSPDKMVWFLDNILLHKEQNIYGITHPQYLIANLALRPWDLPDSTTPFPSYMYIESINVYKLKMDCDSIVNEIFDFSNFYFAVKKSITLSGLTIVPPNANITLRATDYIILNQGFEIPLETEFCLEINSCY